MLLDRHQSYFGDIYINIPYAPLAILITPEEIKYGQVEQGLKIELKLPVPASSPGSCFHQFVHNPYLQATRGFVMTGSSCISVFKI